MAKKENSGLGSGFIHHLGVVIYIYIYMHHLPHYSTRIVHVVTRGNTFKPFHNLMNTN